MIGPLLFVFDEMVPFGRWLRGGLGRVAAAVGHNPLMAALIAALGFGGWQWHRAAGLTDQLRAVQDAQAQAARDQAAVNHEPARKSAEIARISDATAPAYYAAGRSAADAYADAHRLRAAPCPTGHPDLPGAGGAAPVDDAAGPSADVVAVARADFDLLTDNSLRLAKVRQDAEALIGAGVAVASDGAAP